jgi:outer membrane protein TolC
VQQARGELAGAQDAVKRSRDLVDRTEKLARGLTNPVEVNRAATELSRREQAVETAAERWQTASAELARLLRLDSTALAEPIEQPHLRVELIDASVAVDELIPIALRSRPELATQQALVQATLARLKQERMRPLIPSLLLRGNGTNPAGTLSNGTFGGGINSNISNFSARQSLDLQVLWEFQNLGFGNRANIRERQAENQVAVLEMFRVQDRVAAEVVQAHEQARRAANRARFADAGVKNAIESAQKNLEGLSQTRRIGELLVLVIRPQEVVAAIQALDQAYRDYYGAIADANRAQFRLYRALGRPAQCVIKEADDLPTPPAATGPAIEMRLPK